MKVLVTGGNGLLAANVIRELIRRGYETRAMVRVKANKRSLQGVDCEIFYGDILHKPDVDKAVLGCNSVIHVAADTSQNKKSFDDYFPVNVLATQYVIGAAETHDIKRLVFVSTANTMGFGTVESPGTEDNPPQFPFTLSGYAQSKTRAEELVLGASQKGVLEAVVVNPTFMIGPFDVKPGSGKILKMYAGKKLMLVPPGGKNFICVKDAAIGVANALEKGRNGQRYLLAGENLSYMEFFRKVDKVNGKRPLKIMLSPWILRTLGKLVEFFIPGASLNVVTAEILCIYNYYSAEKAKRELDLPQTPIEAGIREALEWFRGMTD